MGIQWTAPTTAAGHAGLGSRLDELDAIAKALAAARATQDANSAAVPSAFGHRSPPVALPSQQVSGPGGSYSTQGTAGPNSERARAGDELGRWRLQLERAEAEASRARSEQEAAVARTALLDAQVQAMAAERSKALAELERMRTALLSMPRPTSSPAPPTLRDGSRTSSESLVRDLARMPMAEGDVQALLAQRSARIEQLHGSLEQVCSLYAMLFFLTQIYIYILIFVFSFHCRGYFIT